MERDTSSVSLVLRLRRASAVQGELVGQVEVVDTGESLALTDAVDLAGIVRRIASAGERTAGRDDVTS